MATDFLIDGMLSGTGLRDAVEGGYVNPEAVGISAAIALDLASWQQRYEEAHFADFPSKVVAALDEQGLVLMGRVRQELGDKEIGYFSNGRMERLA